ncbi:MAG TPA: gliding motility-associated C-terminal domain-containing protein, partial [Bacteroidia bacterium]|nr:gliding motility-associated C-terminal domain-containing protein [Bacteroidia bacterium]
NTTISNPTVNTTSSNVYTVTVVDGNGCRDSATVNLTVNPKPNVNAGNAVAICTGGNTTLTATGASTYDWAPPTGLSSTTVPNPTASPVTTTTYTVMGTDVNGCVNQDTVTVSVGGTMTLSISGNNTICQGSSTTLTAAGAVSYTWSPSTGISAVNIANPNFNPANTTTYTVTGSSASGCRGQDTITVSVNPSPIANAGTNAAYCSGGSVVLNGTGGGTYSWSPSTGLSSTVVNNPTANPVNTTTYTLTVTGANSCTNTATVLVTVNPLPVISVTGTLAVCSGTGTTLTATGASTYSWSPVTGLSSSTVSNPLVTPSATTTYTITGTDANNCTNTTTTTVTYHSNPGVNVTANKTSSCTPFCVTLNGTDSSGSCSSVVYNYGDGNSGSSPNHCYTTAGTYSVSFTCTDANGCSGSINKPSFIQALPSPTAAFSVNPGLLITYTGSKPDSVCFSNTSSSAVSWEWSFGNGSSSNLQNPGCITYADSGTYCVNLKVQSNAGCRDSTVNCVHLEKLAEVSYTIPNVFSPNGDGVNDFFFVKNSGLKSLDCHIYDRWGVQLFSFNSLTGTWDGKTSSGQMASDGVYYYVIAIQTQTGDSKEEKGFIQLIRGD